MPIIWKGWEGYECWVLTAPDLDHRQLAVVMAIKDVNAVIREIQARGYWLDAPYTTAYWAVVAILKAAQTPVTIPELIRKVGVHGDMPVKLPRVYATAAITALLRSGTLRYEGGKVVAAPGALDLYHV